jgi:hypothetical protein
MNKVLISYSLADAEIADDIVRALLKQNQEITRDVRDVNWGESVELKLDKGFGNISAVVIVISSSSLKSQWMPYVIGFASGRGKTVVPFITDSSLELPPDLKNLPSFTEIGQIQKFFRH